MFVCIHTSTRTVILWMSSYLRSTLKLHLLNPPLSSGLPHPGDGATCWPCCTLIFSLSLSFPFSLSLSTHTHTHTNTPTRPCWGIHGLRLNKTQPSSSGGRKSPERKKKKKRKTQRSSAPSQQTRSVVLRLWGKHVVTAKGHFSDGRRCKVGNRQTL